MSQWAVWMMSLMTGSILFLYIRERKLLANKLGELSRRQSGTERVLGEFIQESEKVAKEFSRRLSTTPVAAPQLETQEPVVAAPRKRRTGEKRHQVLNLAEKGRPANEIAERLMIPNGEVELILNLNQGRKARAHA
jgi:hypothetical protein